MKLDELNRLLTRYYDVMDIPKEDKKKRVMLGLDLYDAFIYILLSIKAEYKIKEYSEQTAEKTPEVIEGYVGSLDYRIRDILEENDLPYEDEYIPQLSRDIVETTFRHLDDDYYFSDDRAVLITQNEANTVMNNVDFVNAKKQGKTHKQWIAELDDRTREAHFLVDGTFIPIDEYFTVGSDKMRFPHDYINGSPENLINCRCSCIYS